MILLELFALERVIFPTVDLLLDQLPHVFAGGSSKDRINLLQDKNYQ